MKILNGTRDHLFVRLREMDDTELLAQEILQKGCLHAVTHLLRVGVNEANANAMQRDLGEGAEAIAAECRRRGLPTVTDPRTI